MAGLRLLRWFVRFGLFGLATLCLLLEPLALFVGIDGGGAPVEGAAVVGLIVMVAPLCAGGVLALAGVWFDDHPDYAPYGAVVIGALIIGGFWIHSNFFEHDHTVPPALTAGHDFRTDTIGFPNPKSAEWSALLTKDFPIGTPADHLINVLRAQKFWIAWLPASHEQRNGLYEWVENGCLYSLEVEWATDQERISAISGNVQGHCH